MKLIKDALTGIDGESFDVVRILCASGGITFLALEIFSVGWKSVPFDMQAFGIGFGGFLAAVSAGLKVKETTEPRPDAVP